MSRYTLSSTSRALYRVFVAPNLPTASPLRPSRACVISSSNAIPQTTIRAKSYGKKDNSRHALSDYYTFDNAITASFVNLVDADGAFRAAVPTNRISYNRVTHSLVQISPGKVDEFGVPDPQNLPTCKIMTKMELRMQLQKKLDIDRRVKQGQRFGPINKTLEINWAIAAGDLKHRLEKLKGFLKEGRKVEVVLGPKRRGKQATTEECKHLLGAIREAVEECKGAGQTKEPSGAIGGVMTIVFEGRKIEEKKEVGKEDQK